MKHLILGAGNLGKDIKLELDTTKGEEAVLVSGSTGSDLGVQQVVRDVIEHHESEVVWYCVGGGSVAEAKYDPENSWRFNLNIPMFINEFLPVNRKLILFSTDYVADENKPHSTFTRGKLRSNYAQQKAMMEEQIVASTYPGRSVIRVGSLYGHHKPLKTFPGKILKNFGFNEDRISLPSNIVVPTPTRWIAAMLVRHFEELFHNSKFCPAIEHLAPSGGVTVKDWAKIVLRGLRPQDAFLNGKDYFDEERPLFSSLGCSFLKEDEKLAHWYDVHQFYFRKEWYISKELREELEAPMIELD